VAAVVNPLLQGRERITLLPPLDYELFSFLMNACTLILTDSGGVQEEAPALRKPVFILRDNCERPEVIRSGGALLVGTSRDVIVSSALRVLTNANDYDRMAGAGSPYGDGLASRRIVRSLIKVLSARSPQHA
jgi:UDP-N-acetylglucosamine 2-epimerase (non-hydrolysing)